MFLVTVGGVLFNASNVPLFLLSFLWYGSHVYHLDFVYSNMYVVILSSSSILSFYAYIIVVDGCAQCRKLKCWVVMFKGMS